MIPRLELQLKSLSLTKILAHYQEEAHKAAQEKLSYENYLARLVEMEAMNKLGPLKQIMGMLPMGNMQLPDGVYDVTSTKMVRYRIIMDSMTPGELDDPSLISSSRLQRIARGAGASPDGAGFSVSGPCGVMMSVKLKVLSPVRTTRTYGPSSCSSSTTGASLRMEAVERFAYSLLNATKSACPCGSRSSVRASLASAPRGSCRSRATQSPCSSQSVARADTRTRST